MTAAERQTAETLDQIRADHVARYRYAAAVVGGSVLDAACGCGYGSAILADAGHRVRGVDQDAGAVAFARAHHRRARTEFSVGDVAHAPGAYDWVVCLETLEHLEDDGAALRHFARIARGLVLSVPNQLVYAFEPARHVHHKRHYTPGELAAVLRGAGWDAITWASQRWPASAAVEAGVAGAYLLVTAVRP